MAKKKKSEEKKLEDEIIQEADKEKEDKIASLEDQLIRALADYKNLEKRVEENRRDWVLSSNKSLIVKLLPVLDDLFLAQKHIQDDGLNLSIQKFSSLLKEEGVEEIKTKDVEFDPNAMECVSVQEGEENKILEEIRKGYIINDSVLRPAQVIVGGSAQQNK